MGLALSLDEVLVYSHQHSNTLSREAAMIALLVIVSVLSALVTLYSVAAAVSTNRNLARMEENLRNAVAQVRI